MCERSTKTWVFGWKEDSTVAARLIHFSRRLTLERNISLEIVRRKPFDHFWQIKESTIGVVRLAILQKRNRSCVGPRQSLANSTIGTLRESRMRALMGFPTDNGYFDKRSGKLIAKPLEMELLCLK
jgi:hypothetical protein